MLIPLIQSDITIKSPSAILTSQQCVSLGNPIRPTARGLICFESWADQNNPASPWIYPWVCDMKSPVITVRKEELVIQLTKPTGTCGRSNRPV